MRIALLNSSLEPGRDGVGDYTRLLSEECARQGHACCRVALNDRFVTQAQTANDHGEGIPELRLPASLSWPQRIAQAAPFLDTFAPDWVSLQFVPYGFHPKGLIHGLARRLQPLITGRRVHIMFHELWIGEAIGSPVKHRLVGAMQKRLILNLVATLRPSAQHTSNCTYVEILRRYGIHAERLPLFGAIPVTTQNGDDWIFDALQNAGLDITPENRTQFWLGGFFGALHPTWPSEPLLTQLADAAHAQNRRVALLSIGRMGDAGDALWNRMAAQNAGRLTFCKLGEQPAEKISQYFNTLDFGIASSPASLIGKSSTVAAMLDHGLPVIVNRDDQHFPFVDAVPNNEPLLISANNKLPDISVTQNLRSPAHSRLPCIALGFLNEITRQKNSASDSA